MLRRFPQTVATAGLLIGVGRVLWWGVEAPLASFAAGQARFSDHVTLLAAAGAGTLLLWIFLVLMSTALAALPGEIGRLAGGFSSAVASAQTRRFARLILGFSIAAGPSALVPVALAPVAAALPSPGATMATAEPSPELLAQLEVLPPVGRPEVKLSEWALQLLEESRTKSPTATGERLPTHPEMPYDREAAPPGSNPVQSPTHNQPQPSAPVTVMPGDTLWSIASRSLGRTASDSEIAREWPRWYSANRIVIGSDPDRIRPGMVLRPPPPRPSQPMPDSRQGRHSSL